MAISKQQSRVLAWGILLGTIAIFILTIALQDRTQIDMLSPPHDTLAPSSSTQSTTNTADLSQVNSQLATGDSHEIVQGTAKAELQTFHRVETRNGKTLWEIKAHHGKLMPETSSALIDTATLLLYRPSGEIVRVLADQAVVKLEGATLAAAELTGNVQLAIEGTIDARTNQATLNRKTQTLHAPEHVTLKGKGIFVEGEGLSGDLQTEQYTIHREVSTVITPKS